MSGAKFYVLGGGRWRELDSSGRVEGWGLARFLYVERGRLRAVRRAPVLRGLRALAAGRASFVHDGAPLSQISCGVNAHFNMQVQPVRSVHAGVQADLSRDLRRKELAALPPPDEKTREPARHVAYKRQNNTLKKCIKNKNKQGENTVTRQNNVRLNSSDEGLSASTIERIRKRKMRHTPGAEFCKELIIAEEDVVLLRNYIEKDEKNVFKVDLERFDGDDTYKSKVFYKLNPLVNVERCKAIAAMSWDQQSQSTVSLKDFITNLGLRRVDDPSPSRTSYRLRKRRNINSTENGSEHDKENLASRRQPKINKRPNNVLGESVEEKPNSDRVQGNIKVSDVLSRAMRVLRRAEESAAVEVSDSDDAFEGRRAAASRRRAGGGREYGPGEDDCIVRWLQAGGRAHLVNGNRLWRELQPEHQRLTGHFRSWHSLRNRYLRYLLPSLGALLPAPAASALRAAAARGEIKTRPPPRPHELHERGAWARRPRPPDAEDRRLDISELPRSLRSSGVSPALEHAHTPTYSELTKRFAKRHRSTPNSDTSEVTETERIERRASKRIRASRNADSIRLHDISSRQSDTSGRPVENSSNNADTSGKQTARSRRHADRSNRNADSSNWKTRRSSRIADTSTRHADNRSQTTASNDRRMHRTRRLYNPNL